MKRAVALLAGLLLTSLTWADQTGPVSNSAPNIDLRLNDLMRLAGRLALSPLRQVHIVGRAKLPLSRGDFRREAPGQAHLISTEIQRSTQPACKWIHAAVESDHDDSIPARNQQKHKNADSHDQVVIGQDFVLNAGDAANGDVVVIRGHARIDGTLNGDLVLVGSDAKMKGTANGDFVSIASSIAFESGSILNGDFVSVLSVIHDASQATFNGDRLNLDLLSPHTLRGLGDWFSSTVLFLRPMSPWSPVSWAVALGVLVFCLAIGGVFPKLLTGTGLILRERAPASFLSGVAIVPAAALFCFLLMLTVVGILAIPLVVAALLVFALIGNAAVFNLIGESVAPKLGQKPYALYLWITMGALICWILYCIPVIGFVAGSVVFLAGLGAFTIYMLERSRVAPPAHSPPGTQPTFPGPPALATPVAATASVDRGYPQFWARLGANLIDLVLLYAILDSLRLTRILIPAWVLYRFAMYVWRSTTLGESF